jgi:hypothetical protein
VGEDGRVYTTPTPPPNGRGVIEVKPAAPKARTGNVPQPAAPSAELSPLRRFLQQAADAQRESEARAAGAAAMAEGDSEASRAGDPASPCARHMSWVWAWRNADQSVRNAEANLEALQSDTRGFMTSDESWRLRRMEAAEQRVAAAEENLSQVESDATSAGVPSNCLTQ